MSTVIDAADQRLHWLADEAPDALRLARVASIAVRIEPHLLRRLRTELLPEIDVGTEADLWFSSIVESRSVDAMVLDAGAADRLRRDLARASRSDESRDSADRGLLERACAIVRDAHKHLAPALQLEEQINALALLQGDDALAAIDEALQSALRAMTESAERAGEIARWVLRAWPRLHEVAKRAPAATTLALAASSLLRRRATGAVEANARLRDVGWVVPAADFDRRVEIGIELLDDVVRFTRATDVLASLSVPDTKPPLVDVSWTVDGAGQVRVVDAVDGRTVELGAGATDVRIGTLAGDEYALTRESIAEESDEPVWLDIEPYTPVAEACARVGFVREGSETAWYTAFHVTPQELVTARDPFRGLDRIRFEPSVDSGAAVVLNRDAASDVLVIRDADGGIHSEPVRLATPPLRASASEEGGLYQFDEQNAVILGHAGTELRALAGTALLQDMKGEEFRVVVSGPHRVPDGFIGGPVIIDGMVRGLVKRIDNPPTTGGRSAASVCVIAGAPAIQQSLESVERGSASAINDANVATQAKQAASAGDEATSDDSSSYEARLPPRVTPESGLPRWVYTAVASVHALGDNIPPLTCIAISRERVVTIGGDFEAVPFVDIRRGEIATQAGAVEADPESPLRVLELIEQPHFEPPFSPLAVDLQTSSRSPGWPYINATAYVIGLVDGVLRVVTGQAHRANPDDARFEVEVDVPMMPATMRGGPVIIDGALGGVLLAIEQTGSSSGVLTVATVGAIAEAIERVRGARVPGMPEGMQAVDPAAAGFRFAKVVVIGSKGSGRSELIRALGAADTAQRIDDRCTLWWYAQPDVAQERWCIALWESNSSPNWPLAIDLEDAAAAVIVSDVNIDTEADAGGWLERIRAVTPDLPVMLVGSQADTLTDDAKSALLSLESVARRDAERRGSGVTPEGMARIVSAKNGINVEMVRSALVSRIDWPDQPAVDETAFARARQVAASTLASRPAVKGSTTRPTGTDDHVWMDILARLTGERTANGITIRDPALFESLVIAIMDAAAARPWGVPAESIDDISRNWSSQASRWKQLETLETGAQPLIRAAAAELGRLGVAMTLRTERGEVVTVPHMFEEYFMPSRPHQDEPLLRANWTGTAHDVFLTLVVRFAFAFRSIREVAWDRDLRRGGAWLEGDRRFYLEASESGDVADLYAIPEDRSRPDPSDRSIHWLRENLEELLADNRSLSVDVH